MTVTINYKYTHNNKEKKEIINCNTLYNESKDINLLSIAI